MKIIYEECLSKGEQKTIKLTESDGKELKIWKINLEKLLVRHIYLQ